MAKTDDLISSYSARLDQLIKSYTDKLISCSRDEHDRLAGQIAGLLTAQKEITSLAKQWRMRDEED